jgi:hypothetical protein
VPDLERNQAAIAPATAFRSPNVGQISFFANANFDLIPDACLLARQSSQSP